MLPAIYFPPLKSSIPLPSKWKLFFQTYFTLILTVGIGTLLSIPLVSKRIRTYRQTAYLVESFPSDDKALQDLALSRPQVFSIQTERSEKEFRIRSEAWGADQHPHSGATN